jgi:hypothetical protein
MKSLHQVVTIASLCFFTASAGYAQQDAKDGKAIPVEQESKPVSQDEWQFSVTPYTFLPSVDVKFNVPEVTIGNRTIGGDISVTQPLWKTISKLSSNFYVLSLGGRLEAWKGCWGGFLDGYWIFGKEHVSGSDSRLVFRDRVDITTSSSVTDRFGTGQINFGPQFKLGTASLSPDSNVSFVLYGGGRVNWLTNDDDGTITIRASANPGEIGQTFHFSTSKGRAFIEPMIGLKTSWALGPKVKAILRGDVGGFGFVDSNNWDCDLETGIAWEAWRNTYIDLGYRARGQWQDLGANENGNLRGWYYGPELGVTFSF